MWNLNNQNSFRQIRLVVVRGEVKGDGRGINEGGQKVQMGEKINESSNCENEVNKLCMVEHRTCA